MRLSHLIASACSNAVVMLVVFFTVVWLAGPSFLRILGGALHALSTFGEGMG